MSLSSDRKTRCYRALDSALTFLRKGKSASDDVRQLEDVFRSSTAILECNTHSLRSNGLSEAEADLLTMIPSLTRYAVHAQHQLRPRLDTLSSASEYLKTLYIGVPVEQFYVLSLDAAGKLIRCHNITEGTIDQTPFYLGSMLQSVINNQAKAVILSHNHPGGTLRPSQADIDCTESALNALFPLGVPLLDHIIIADNEAVSIRENGFVPAGLWRSQNVDSKLIDRWLT